MERALLREAMNGTRNSHERLLATLAGLKEEDVAEPSLLPGWTRGHLLTHMARNADSHVRLLTASARGERVEQYVGGSDGRAADIEAGAARPAAELAADVRSSAGALFHVWETVPEGTWDREVVAIHGGQPAWVCIFSRWRETEMHHADLDLGYTWRDWPPDFISATLPDLVATLGDRLPAAVSVSLQATDRDLSATSGADRERPPVAIRGTGADLLAWLSGRSDGRELSVERGALPDLEPWL